MSEYNITSLDCLFIYIVKETVRIYNDIFKTNRSQKQHCIKYISHW